MVARRRPLPDLDIAVPQRGFPTHGRPQGPHPYPTPLPPLRETRRLTIFSFLLLLRLMRIEAKCLAVAPIVTLSAAKGLARWAARSFAALRMTGKACEQHNTGVREGVARSFAALRMTGLSFLPSSGLPELMRGLG